MSNWIDCEFDCDPDARGSHAPRCPVKLEADIAELKLALDCELGVRRMTVDRLGGQVEGHPTQSINFLQRIDELVDRESENAALREENERLKGENKQKVATESWGMPANSGLASVEEIDELREGLKKLEWIGAEHCGMHEDSMIDPHWMRCAAAVCRKFKCEGHTPDCWLAKLVE